MGAIVAAHAVAHAEIPAPPDEVAESSPTGAVRSASEGSLPVGLVISGGVSLGAYQAGATYALVRYLREHRGQRGGYDLALATGASAGNINAFLAALTWCAEREPSVFRNDLYRTWSAVGWDALSPADPDLSPYVGPDDPDGKPRDGLLARDAFRTAEVQLAALLDHGVFREGCRVDIGVTVNRVQPELLTASDWRAEAQRYVVPMRFTAHGSGVTIVNRPLGPKRHAEMGLELRLESDGYGRLSPERILDVVKASSAFPGAFGAVQLKYCPSTGARNAVCQPSDESQPVRFSDGGLFDNIPLGLARALWADEADETAAGADARPGPIYAYVDSDLRRGAPEMPPTRVRPEGSAAALDLAGRLVSEGRHYELLIEDDLEAVTTSSRFHPLMGDVFAAFGAFFHRAFREYDYRVGLYDGIYTLAQRLGSRGSSGAGGGDDAVTPPSREAFDAVRAVVLGLGDDCAIEGDGPRTDACARRVLAHYFLERLFTREQSERRRGDLEGTAETAREGDPAAEPKRCEVTDTYDQCVAKLAIEQPTRPERSGWYTHARQAWAVDAVLRDLDHERRRRQRIGERIDRREAAARMTDIVEVMDRLQAADPHILGNEAPWLGGASSAAGGDGRVWRHRMLDRLVRRAIMVQQADMDRCGPACDEVGVGNARPALELARLGLALTAERPRGLQLELAGLDERLAGDMPRGRLPTLISALVPSTVMLGMGSGSSTLELGYAVNDVLRSYKLGVLGGGLRLETLYQLDDPGETGDAREDPRRWALRMAIGMQARWSHVRLTLEGTARPRDLIPEPADMVWGLGFAVDVGTWVPLRLRGGVEWEGESGPLVSVAAGLSDVGVIAADGFDRPGWGPLHSPPASLWWIPYTVAWEPGTSGIRVGQGLRLRWNRDERWLIPLDVTYIYRALRGEDEQHSVRGEVGFGYDPGGWLIDDLALRGQWTLNPRTRDQITDGFGVELSVELLRLLSVGIGLDRLGASDRRGQPGWTPIFSVGLVNVNGLVAWAARSGWGFDEVRP